MLMPEGLRWVLRFWQSESAEAKVGNCLPLRNIPVGFTVHNVEIKPGSGGKFARSAGTSVNLWQKKTIMQRSKCHQAKFAWFIWIVGLRLVLLVMLITRILYWGKAGRYTPSRNSSRVRGMAMNPVDHPHGGGEGRSKSGSHP